MEPYNGFKVGDIVRATDDAGVYFITNKNKEFVGKVVRLADPSDEDEDIIIVGVSIVEKFKFTNWDREYAVHSRYFELDNPPSEDDKFLNGLYKSGEEELYA